MDSVEGPGAPGGAPFREAWELRGGHGLDPPSAASDRPPCSAPVGVMSYPCILHVNKGNSAAGGVCAVFLTVAFPGCLTPKPISQLSLSLLSQSQAGCPVGRAL